jgi:class 3 adenylate cyclase
MEAVHRFEGTVNQVMGDGIMALFGAPIARLRGCGNSCHDGNRRTGKICRRAATSHRAPTTRNGKAVRRASPHRLEAGANAALILCIADQTLRQCIAAHGFSVSAFGSDCTVLRDGRRELPRSLS